MSLVPGRNAFFVPHFARVRFPKANDWLFSKRTANPTRSLLADGNSMAVRTQKWPSLWPFHT